ncbi:MAG: HPr family phosphocarrier protein [Clostridia bacterium]|nr:HPr family phosphocarrier protein [Clostridia bacterium]
MKTFNVKLSTFDDVKQFVSIATMFDGDVDLKSGRYLVDAKSIMGIFSLDLMKPIEVTVYSDNCDDFVKSVEKFVVE